MLEFRIKNQTRRTGVAAPQRRDSGLGTWNHIPVIALENARSAFHNVPMSQNTPNASVRRMKTYTGAQGYVYQYYFVGKRPALADDPEAPAIEFIFDVTSDRKLTFAVSVFLPQSSIESWNKAHGRALNDAEQYAAVKMRLFRAFDELDDVKGQGRRLSIDAALLENV